MQSVRICLNRCVRRGTSFSSAPLLGQKYSTAGTSTTPAENLSVPPPSNVDKRGSEKIERLFDDISKLNLIEVCELSELLKKRLKLSDISAVQSTVAAPVDEEDEEPVTAKTNFTVKLMGFEEESRRELIKTIRNIMEGMNLLHAKNFLDSAPVVVKADITKEESDKLKELLEKAGATVQVD